MSSQNSLKFGVEFKGNGQLFTLESTAIYDNILSVVSKQFGIPEAEIPNYCLRKTDRDGATEYYTNEENCRIKTGDVVQLVEIPTDSSKVIIPPTITVTTTTDSDSEFSRTPSSISLVSSDICHVNELDDSRKSSKSWSLCHREFTDNENNCHSSSPIISSTNYTVYSSVHSNVASTNHSELPVYSTASINAHDSPHKSSADQIFTSSEIFNSTFNHTQSSISSSNHATNDILSSPYRCYGCLTSLRSVLSSNRLFGTDDSNIFPYSSTLIECNHSNHHRKSPYYQTYAKFTERQLGFTCLCHSHKQSQATSDAKSDSNVTLFDQISPPPSLSSSSTSLSSPTNNIPSIQHNDSKQPVRQSKTLLRRFRSFIIQSVRKSGRSVNFNEGEKSHTVEDSVVVKHNLIDRNKKRSKSLRTIPNCVLSASPIIPSMSSSNGEHCENKAKLGNKSSCSSSRLRLHSDCEKHFDEFTRIETDKIRQNDKTLVSSDYLMNARTCQHFGIVSKAVEKFISILNQELDYLFHNNSNNNNNNNNKHSNNNNNSCSSTTHHLQELFKQTLMELVIVLQCRQFIRDFVKCEGHCKLFQLVEAIDKLDREFHDQIWPHLLSCLAELSKYAITNRLIAHNQDNMTYPITCYTTNDNYRPCSSDEMTTKQNNEKVNPVSLRSISHIVSGSNREEFFSWQLVSDHFLFVIIDHCRRENNLVCLKHELKLILKIVTDYPVRIQYVIEQTKHGFILDLLKMIHVNTTIYNYTVGGSTQKDELRCDMQNLIMKFLYVVFYYAKQNDYLSSLIPQYLRNIRFVEWIPELSNRYFWESIITPYHRHCHYDQSDYSVETVNSYSLLDFNDDNSEITFVLKRMNELSRILDKNDPPHEEEEDNQGNMKNYSTVDDTIGPREKDNNNNSNKNPCVQLFGSLCRVQQLINSLLLNRMNTPLDRTSAVNMEKMNQLCSAVYCDEYTLSPSVESMEEACIRLGFKIPTDPYADFQESPGSLAFHSIHAYAMKNKNKLIDMLSYAYPLQKYDSFTSYRKSNFLSEFPSPPLNTNNSLNLLNNLYDDGVGGDTVSGGYGVGVSGKTSRVHRHFSAVDSNYIKYLLNTAHSRYDSEYCYNTGRRFTVDSLSSSLQQTYKPFKGMVSSHSSSYYYYYPPTSLTEKRPLFPVIEAANAVTRMLCELISVHSEIYDSQFIIEEDANEFCLPSLFYPILLSYHGLGETLFEDLFDCVFSTFFYTWTQMKAVPEDLVGILCVVREQINRILKTTPISFEEFEKSLANFNPYDVPSMWSKRENNMRMNMLHNHPALIQLRNDLKRRHQDHVYENRLNILSTSAPLEYIPSKGSKLSSKDNQSFTVLLSTDRKSFVIRDANQAVREIWPLKSVIRVSLGAAEKVKKNPERTLIFHVELSDVANQDDSNESVNIKSRCFRASLLARSTIEYHYWLDGLFLVNKLNNPSDYYSEDVERLIDLDMRIRLSSLDLNELPKREISIPPDPPPLDFV